MYTLTIYTGYSPAEFEGHVTAPLGIAVLVVRRFHGRETPELRH